jgi:hypothetical protein
MLAEMLCQVDLNLFKFKEVFMQISNNFSISNQALHKKTDLAESQKARFEDNTKKAAITAQSASAGRSVYLETKEYIDSFNEVI